jgi:hypothetical protein
METERKENTQENSVKDVKEMSLFERIVKICKELNVPKDNDGAYGKYRDLDSILLKLVPKMKEYRVFYSVSDKKEFRDGMWITSYVGTFINIDNPEERFSTTMDMFTPFLETKRDINQNNGTTNTYNLRYIYARDWQIKTGDDVEKIAKKELDGFVKSINNCKTSQEINEVIKNNSFEYYQDNNNEWTDWAKKEEKAFAEREYSQRIYNCKTIQEVTDLMNSIHPHLTEGTYKFIRNTIAVPYCKELKKQEEVISQPTTPPEPKTDLNTEAENQKASLFN